MRLGLRFGADERGSAIGFAGADELPVLLIELVATAFFTAAVIFGAVITVFGQTYSTERLCYVLIALVVPPTTLVVTLRTRANYTDELLARSSEPTPIDNAADTRAWNAVGRLGLTALAVLAARISRSNETSLLLTLLLVLVLALGHPLSRLASHMVTRAAPLGSQYAFAAAPLLVGAGAVAFVPAGGATAGRLAIGGGAGLLGAGIVWLTRGLGFGPRVRLACDLIAVVLVVGTVCQLTGLNLDRSANQNYFLGPTNDVLHGRLMLVNTFSQYGVGMFYALAALFSFLTPGYGTMSLVLSVATGLLLLSIFLVLRLSLRSQVIAIAGAVAVAFVYTYNVGHWQYLDTPSTGVLRFGIPWLIALSSVGEARATRPRTRTGLRGLTLALLAVAAVWSAETAMYSIGAAAAVALVDSASFDGTPGLRLRIVTRRLLLLALTALASVLALTLATLIAAGQLPQFGPYITFLRLYTVTGFGLLPIQPWSQGLAVGALYGASTALVVGLLALSPETIRARLPAFCAIAAVTAMGALEFTYFLGRAAPSNLIWVSPPIVALLFLWLGTAGSLMGSRAPRAVAAGSICVFAALSVIGARPYMKLKFDGSLLGSVIAERPSLGSAVSTLAGNPVVFPVSVRLAGLLDSPALARRRVALIAYAPVESEALLRARRPDGIGETNPCQSELSVTAAGRVLDEVRTFPLSGLLIVFANASMPLLHLQQYELRLMRARFRLTVTESKPDLKVYDLSAVRSTWNGGAAIAKPPVLVSGGAGCA